MTQTIVIWFARHVQIQTASSSHAHAMLRALAPQPAMFVHLLAPRCPHRYPQETEAEAAIRARMSLVAVEQEQAEATAAAVEGTSRSADAYQSDSSYQLLDMLLLAEPSGQPPSVPSKSPESGHRPRRMSYLVAAASSKFTHSLSLAGSILAADDINKPGTASAPDTDAPTSTDQPESSRRTAERSASPDSRSQSTPHTAPSKAGSKPLHLHHQQLPSSRNLAALIIGHQKSMNVRGVIAPGSPMQCNDGSDSKREGTAPDAALDAIGHGVGPAAQEAELSPFGVFVHNNRPVPNLERLELDVDGE